MIALFEPEGALLMIALFETRDGMTRWQMVDEGRPPLVVRFAMMPDLSFVPRPLEKECEIPAHSIREYELIEHRRDRIGKVYAYYREKL
jgi:hypothetical protein